MAIKTFTTGEVLTAADTNTYLANSGLVYVKSQTIGSGVTSVTVSNAFSTTYDSYKIFINGGTASAGTSLDMTLGSTATGYYSSMIYGNYATNAVAALGSNNGVAWIYAGAAITSGIFFDVTLHNPFLAKPTQIIGAYTDSGNAGPITGFLNNTTSYTAFTLTGGAALTGGTINVYGYRKA